MKVIVTSYLFPDAKFSLERLQKLASMVGKDKLVVDVRCAPYELSLFAVRNSRSVYAAAGDETINGL